MKISGKFVEKEVLSSILYMQTACINRGMIDVGLDIFTYSIFVSNREYIEEYIDQASVNNVLEMFSNKFLEVEEKNSDIKLFDLKYDNRISEIVRSRRSGGGIMSCIFDIMTSDSDLNEGLINCGVDMNAVQNGSASESMKNNLLKKQIESTIKNKTSKKRNVKNDLPSEEKIDYSNESSFYVDLTKMAKLGKIPEAYGREQETKSVILTLLRRVKGNPLLIGEAGVGKTAVVERLARMIANDEVPDKLLGCTLYSVNIASLVAGTSLRGMLEDRLQKFMNEVAERNDVIIFIDEIHMIVGTGDSNGSSDICNMMKQYLARGNVRCIGATTIGDFNKYMRKDSALCRRFQRVNVEEMNHEQTLKIIECCQKSYEDFHGVCITKDAIEKAISLSGRFIVDRRFPDKAIDCIDDACARASLMDDGIVNQHIVEESISSLSSIPISIIRSKDSERTLKALEIIPNEILGNYEAIKKMCNVVANGFTRTLKRNRPLSSFVVHGPKGVGKKSSIQKLSKIIYGDNSVIEIDGHDYSEPHSIGSVIGSPPGYVGYGDDGRIYSSVRKKPYSFILVTNFENMHPNIRSHIVRIIKSGIMEDAKGITVDFRNSIFVFCQDDRKESGGMGFSKFESSYILEKSIWASILGEVDAEVIFNTVDSSDMKKIAWLEASSFLEDISESNKNIDVGEAMMSEMYNRCLPVSSPSEMRRKIREQLDNMAHYSSAMVRQGEVNGNY